MISTSSSVHALDAAEAGELHIFLTISDLMSQQRLEYLSTHSRAPGVLFVCKSCAPEYGSLLTSG
jgi:hypothetical protein